MEMCNIEKSFTWKICVDNDKSSLVPIHFGFGHFIQTSLLIETGLKVPKVSKQQFVCYYTSI